MYIFNIKNQNTYKKFINFTINIINNIDDDNKLFLIIKLVIISIYQYNQ